LLKSPHDGAGKALEFLLFDLSSCVMTIDEAPKPPIVVK
jgi:hypothetical protein